MPIRTAVITAAGRGLKPYPAWDTPTKLLHPLIDVDGQAKPILEVVAEQAFSAGIEQIVLVVAPGDEAEYRAQLDTLARLIGSGPHADLVHARRLGDLLHRLRFAVQAEPLGIGHALWQAREHLDGGPVLMLMCDHLFLATGGTAPVAEAVALADAGAAVVSSVVAQPEHAIHRFGVVGGKPVSGCEGRWQVERVIEKPTPTQAELHLEVSGLRRNHYLCLSGIHILPPALIEVIGGRIAAGGEGCHDLSPVLDEFARRSTYLAVQPRGRHQDIGVRYGLLEAQIERALLGPDRERVLEHLLEIVARTGKDAGR